MATPAASGRVWFATLTLSGSAPTGGARFEVPAFLGNVAATTAGTVDNARGVALPPGTSSVTVALWR